MMDIEKKKFWFIFNSIYIYFYNGKLRKDLLLLSFKNNNRKSKRTKLTKEQVDVLL